MGTNKRTTVFITILISIFKDQIKFNRTKKQQLIPKTILMQPNKFKTFCVEFVNHFDIKWNKTDILPLKINKIYQKDKDRSNKIHESFIKCLQDIQQLLIKSKKKYDLFSEKISYVPFLDQMKNDAINNNSSALNIQNTIHQQHIDTTPRQQPVYAHVNHLRLNNNINLQLLLQLLYQSRLQQNINMSSDMNTNRDMNIIRYQVLPNNNMTVFNCYQI